MHKQRDGISLKCPVTRDVYGLCVTAADGEHVGSYIQKIEAVA